jgi:hypothetical protein
MSLARGKRHGYAGVGLLALLVAPLALAQGSFFRVAPGPLDESHAEYDNSEGCPKCHEANTGVTNARCLDCHKILRARMASKSGLHASFTGKCIQCHPGHKGRTTSIIDWQHVGGQQTFDHERTGFALGNHHAQLACTACHVKRMKSGRISYLGLERACESCHKGVHRFARPELAKHCDLCHEPGKVNRGMRLGDRESKHFEWTKLLLPGKHLEQPCIKCHPKAEMPGRPEPRTCTDCHRPSHPTPPALAKCADCHKEAEPWKSATVDHRRFGFALLGKHATLGCKRCHPAGAKTDYSPGACTNCHQHRNAHKGQFTDRPCDSCHIEGGKRTLPFDHNKDTRFRLEGFHADPKVRGNCANCHAQKIYRTEKLACVDCHKDKHKGQSGPKCTECHSVNQRWKDARYNRKHEKFPLEGLHRQVKCLKCHPDSKYKLGHVQCVDCHGKTDPHKGRLGTACEKCHVPEKGAPKFNHDKMTHFARTGAHQRVECGYCHRTARAEPPAVGWTKLEPAAKLDRTFPLMGKRCVDCHADPHKGQVGADCKLCHDTASFHRLSAAGRAQRPSDHDRGWLGRHVTLPFDDNDLSAEGRSCARCHGTPACDRCHRTVRPKSHTALWRLRTHGTAAAFDSESCRVCHVTGACIQCHRTSAPLNHRGAWGTLHGYAAGTFADNNCYVCHSRADCQACHRPR